MITKSLSLLLASVLAISAQAASTASDNASNAPYQPGNMWPDASNGGTGFGAWSFVAGVGAGRYIGGTGVNMDPSFGIFAGDAASSSVAERPFTGALLPGQRFTVQVGATNVPTGEVGMNLLDGINAVFTFKFVNGGTLWQLNDGGTDFGTNIGFVPNTPINFAFTYNGGTNYDVVITQGATTFSGLNFNANSVITNITGVRFFSNQQGAGENFGFNNLAIGAGAPMASSVASRKIHGAAGPFDINLPTTGGAGVECRSGGGTNDYQVIFNFATTVTFTSAAVTTGTGSVSGSSGSGTNAVAVNLTGVTNAQTITVTLNAVNNGTTTGNVSAPMGVLIGDTGANGSVNAADIGQTKAQSGQGVTGTNFREDVNADGSVNASDVGLVKSRSGTALP